MATAKKPAITGLFADLIDEIEVPADVVITDDISLSMPTRAQMKAYHASNHAEGKNRAIFGEHYDALIAMFDDQPNQIWNAFVDRVSEHFFGPGSSKVEGN